MLGGGGSLIYGAGSHVQRKLLIVVLESFARIQAAYLEQYSSMSNAELRSWFHVGCTLQLHQLPPTATHPPTDVSHRI